MAADRDGLPPMTAPPAGALEACLALLEKATPERWGASGEERVVIETLMFCGDVAPVTADSGRYRGDIASIQSCNHIGPHGISREESAANADLIVAAVNLLKDHGPALLAALRLREGWQPIETAPKDGSMFICWVDAMRYGERDDGSLDQADVSAADFCEWRDMGDGDGFWMPYASPHGDSEIVTHWMPIIPPSEA